MATYYVRVGGSDAANGLTSATAWATPSKALGAAGIASGDTVYFGGGSYRTNGGITVAMTSPTAETKILGDVTGQYTGDAGPVIWTTYTNDNATPAGSSGVLDINGRNFLTFEDIRFVGHTSSATGRIIASTGSHDLTFRRCTFFAATGVAGSSMTAFFTAAGVTSNLTFDSCVWLAPDQVAGLHIITTFHTADYASGLVVQNCLFVGLNQAGLTLGGTGSGTGKQTGGVIKNCTFLGQNWGIFLGSNVWFTGTPFGIYNSVFWCATNGIFDSTAGQSVEDYNYIQATTPRTGVSAGANSKTNSGLNLLVDMGELVSHGFQPRPFLTPLAGSPLLGYGNNASSVSADFLGRPRPAGGASASKGIGYVERHDTWGKETGTVRTGTAALSITGPGDHDFLVPVDTNATTLRVYLRYDGSYGAGTKPQMSILNGGEVGVADATATMAGAANQWEQVSLSFTPTARGYLTVRLISAAAAAGKALADDFEVV